MVKRFSSVTIADRCFDPATKLKLFNQDTTRLSIVFGRNGAGKSTISQAIHDLKTATLDKDVVPEYDTEVFDFSGRRIDYSNSEYKRIHIYNENFIFENVRIDKEGLNAIVMLGPIVGIEDKIKDAIARRDEAVESKRANNQLIEKLEDTKDSACPEYLSTAIKNSMKDPGRWAHRERDIKGNIRPSPVDASVFSAVVSTNSSRSLQALQIEFDEKFETYKKISSGEGEYLTVISLDNFDTGIDERLEYLLSKRIEAPDSTRDSIILDIITSDGQESLERSRQIFSSDETSYCPTCFRPVTVDDKKRILSEIERVLNQEVENHKIELNALVLSEIEFDVDQYENLDEKARSELSQAISTFNKAIDVDRKLITSKLAAVHKPIYQGLEQLSVLFASVKKAAEHLEYLRVEHNKAVKNKSKLEKELRTLNIEIAVRENEELIKQYTKQLKAHRDAEQQASILSIKIESIEQEIENLESTKRNEQVALKIINDSLVTLFCSKKRLVLTGDKGVYRILVNEKPVKPDKVSVGERNAIALCYFFANAMQGRSSEDAFNEESLFIIDDPISSFDFENKIGVYVFLKSQVDAVLMANKDSKVLLMTHDLLTAYDLEKMSQDMHRLYISQHNIDDVRLKGFRETRTLERGEVEDGNWGDQPYSMMLQNIYLYAVGDDRQPDNMSSQEDSTIGNMMRRVLESFSTFQYKTGMKELVTNPDVLNQLSDEQSAFFRSLMYRLVLNGESHQMESVQSFEGIIFPEMITSEEKRNTAQDILCLMYSLQPNHLIAHLTANTSIEKKELMQSIAGWQDSRGLTVAML